ncbi:hypothetical protein EJ994_03305 [Maribacter sp. MJ134]|uniref:hypothetical protein n=1 Tax=Maribacter sp. MJ134 TaxID=2496865 RepID=UPI000F846837|nr:hypothetical protein [Maribacter sp. MJ134]AZQ57878.1 hypothetical protein EJ994_03305 [Maribacter sp. MJ134]
MNEFNKYNPFKTPDGYFEKLSESLKDAVGHEAPKLPKEDGFALPDGYFENLHSNIRQKLNVKETKVVQLHPFKKYYMAVASVAALFLLVLGLNWNTEQQASWDDLANSEIDSYFENNDFGLTSYEIAEEIPVDGMEISDFLNTQLNEAHIVDYLDENIDDFDDLNLEDEE